MSGPIIKKQEVITSADELVERNGQKSARVSSPEIENLLREHLEELKDLNKTLKLIYNIGL